MKWIYIFLRTWASRRLTFSESIKETNDTIRYEKSTGEILVKAWENPNDMNPDELYEGSKPIIGGALKPICKRKN